MTESYNILDVEIDFSKQTLKIIFEREKMKKIKSALDKNNYTKLLELLQNVDDTTIQKCLIYAIHYGMDKISKKMIKKLSNKLDLNKNNSEIFRYAVYYDRRLIVSVLIDIGVDVHADDDYAFIKYCLAEPSKIDYSLINKLIDKGANIYARNSLALIQASGNGNLDLVKILLEKMEKQSVLELNTDFSKPTNFDIAMISATLHKHNQIVLELLAKGADPLTNNSEVIVCSTENGNTELVKIFLENGVDPNILDGTILRRAAKNGYYDIVKLLVDLKKNDEYLCDLAIDDSAAVRWAAYKGHYDIVKLLIESKTSDGTPRCDIHAENNDAYRLATKYNHTNVVQLLEEHGGHN